MKFTLYSAFSFAGAAFVTAVGLESPYWGLLLIACLFGSAIAGCWAYLTAIKNNEPLQEQMIHIVISVLSGMAVGFLGTFTLISLNQSWSDMLVTYPPMTGFILSLSGYKLTVMLLDGLLAKQVEKRLNSQTKTK